jgi:hypothetical protein
MVGTEEAEFHDIGVGGTAAFLISESLTLKLARFPLPEAELYDPNTGEPGSSYDRLYAAAFPERGSASILPWDLKRSSRLTKLTLRESSTRLGNSLLNAILCSWPHIPNAWMFQGSAP